MKLCILMYTAPPIVLQSICYKLLLMCAKNYQIWLRRFKDKSKNVHWTRFFGPRCVSGQCMAFYMAGAASA